MPSLSDHQTPRPSLRHQQFWRQATTPHPSYQDSHQQKNSANFPHSRPHAAYHDSPVHLIQDLVMQLTLRRNHALHLRPKSLLVLCIHLPILSGRQHQRGQRYARRSTEHDMTRGRAAPFAKRIFFFFVHTSTFQLLNKPCHRCRPFCAPPCKTNSSIPTTVAE